MPEIVTKYAKFMYFWVRILKNYCHIWNQHLQISEITKFGENMKMSKCETKIAFFRLFLGFNLKIKLPYLKSVQSNLSDCKISRKNKIA